MRVRGYVAAVLAGFLFAHCVGGYTDRQLEQVRHELDARVEACQIEHPGAQCGVTGPTGASDG